VATLPHVLEMRQGARPVPADGLPVVGRIPDVSNLTVAFTHSGATLALALGHYLAGEIVDGHPPVGLLEPYQPVRFTAWSAATRRSTPDPRGAKPRGSLRI
jgi:glycine/D-amino acid oxidase-like deaminating enzyme